MSVAPIRHSHRALNKVNDSQPGTLASETGMLGRVVEYDTNAKALAVSDTAVGTLRRGKYMYVKNSGSAATRGQAAFPTDLDNFEVSNAGSAVKDGKIAGVFISDLGAGKYGFIQVEGDTTVLCDSSVGGTTDGNLGVVTTTSNTFQAVADGTAGGTDTAGEAKRHVGVFLEAPANDQLKRLDLRNTVYARRSASA